MTESPSDFAARRNADSKAFLAAMVASDDPASVGPGSTIADALGVREGRERGIAALERDLRATKVVGPDPARVSLECELHILKANLAACHREIAELRHIIDQYEEGLARLDDMLHGVQGGEERA